MEKNVILNKIWCERQDACFTNNPRFLERKSLLFHVKASFDPPVMAREDSMSKQIISNSMEVVKFMSNIEICI